MTFFNIIESSPRRQNRKKMSQVEKNQKVTISYTIRDSEGQLIEKTPEKNPLTYLHGYNYIIPGLEEFLEGKKERTSYSDIFIPASKAFGEYIQDLVVSVSKEELSHLEEIEVGMELELFTEEENSGSPGSKHEMFRMPESPEDLFRDDDDDEENELADEESSIFYVRDITDDAIILDGNHKYAGRSLVVEVNILYVEPASVEEIEKGFLDENDDDNDDNMMGFL